MKSFIYCCLWLLVATAAPSALAAPARLTPLPPLTGLPAPTPGPAAQVSPPAASVPTPIYSGQGTPDQAGLTLSSWGAGSASDSTAINLGGGHVISVTTVDPYQGGLLTFNTPYVLGALTDSTRYLQMTMQFPRAVIENNGGGRFGGGGFGGGRRGRRGRGRFGGGDTGDDNGDDGTDTTPVNPNGPPVITYLRWVFTLANGQQAEVRRPLPDGAIDGNAPFNLAVPLSVLNFSAPSGNSASASTALQSILITADGYSDLYVGSIQIVTDSTPLTAYAGVDHTVTKGDEVTLQANGTGGASTLEYAWDFDTHGPFVDEEQGQTATTRYYTGGKDYTVTLRVSDLDGIKAPAVSTMTVHVQNESDNPPPNFGAE